MRPMLDSYDYVRIPIPAGKISGIVIKSPTKIGAVRIDQIYMAGEESYWNCADIDGIDDNLNVQDL